MEELWSKGEAGIDFDSSPRIIEPDHFQCMFLIMGCIFSLKLIALLWDILTAPPTNHLLDSDDPQSREDQSNPHYQFCSLMLAGLSACLLITLNNLLYFYFSLWTLISSNHGKGDSVFGDYEINMEKFIRNKTVAFAIVGYGAVTSITFIFIAMMRNLGITNFLVRRDTK